MLRFVADENFNREILRGALLEDPTIDIVRAQDEGLTGIPDPDLLAWAAAQGRVLVTHDRRTMPRFLRERILGGESSPGVILIGADLDIGRAIEEFVLIARLGNPSDVSNRVYFVP